MQPKNGGPAFFYGNPTDDYRLNHNEYPTKNESNMIFSGLIQKMVRYDNSGIIEMNIVSFIFFLVYGLFWIGIFDRTSIGQYLQERNISAAFSIMDIVVAFVYKDQLMGAVEAFVSMPLKFVNILLSINNISETMSGYLSVTATGKCDQCVNEIQQFFEILRAINYITLHLYLKGKDKIRAPYSDRIANVIYLYSDDYTSPAAQLKLLIKEAKRSVKFFALRGYLSDPDEINVNTKFDELSAKLDVSLQSTSVVAPPELKDQLNVAMGFYILLIIPLNMYSLVNTLTPLMLPIIMYMFIGSIITKWWIGDPFDPNPRTQRFDYYKIREENDISIEWGEWYALTRKQQMENMYYSVLPCVHEQKKPVSL